MRNIFTSLTSVIFTCLLAAGLASAVPFALVFFNEYINTAEKLTEAERTKASEIKKAELKHDTELFAGYIRFLRESSEAKLRQRLSDAASKAYLITSDIYSEHGTKESRERIIRLVSTPLFQLRFLNGSGYIFAVDREGKTLFSPVSADLRKKLDPQKLKEAVTDSEGFLNILSNKNGLSEAPPLFSKRIHVRYFRELDLFICSAIYFDDFEKDLMRSAADFASSLEAPEGEKLFIVSDAGVLLTGKNAGDNLMAVNDPQGRDVLNSHMETARRGGGFVKYTLNSYENGGTLSKISYVMPVEGWNWVIGKTAEIPSLTDTSPPFTANMNTVPVYSAFFAACTGLFLIAAYLRFKIRSGFRKIEEYVSKSFETKTAEPEPLTDLPDEFRKLAETIRPLLAVLFDESRQKKEQKLFYSKITDSIPLGIYTKSIKNSHRFSIWNEAMTFMFGVPSSSAIGKTEDELRDEFPLLPVFRATDKDAELMKSFIITKETEVKTTKGKLIVTVTAIPVFNEKGDVETILGIVENKTSGRKLEKELTAKTAQLEELNHNLEEAIKAETEKRRKNEHLLFEQSKFTAMGQMINAIAHQWRQPINALGLYIQDFEDSFESGEMNMEYVKSMTESCMHLIVYLSKTIDDFRNFYAANEAKVRFNTAELVFESLGMITAKAEYANIKLFVVMNSSEPIPVYGHMKTEDCKNTAYEAEGFPTEFKQVLLNIYHNAVEAISENKKSGKAPRTGTIVTSVTGGSRDVTVEIKDNGGGIPEDIMPDIFDPYFTTKEQGKGSGVGLYMCRTVIETNMSGKISARNEDDGAVFTITLPR